MVDPINLLEPFINLDNEEVKETVNEISRIYFSSTGATVSLIPSLIIGLLALLGLLKLLGIPILASFGFGGQDGGDGGDGGYGAPSGGYGEPSTGYGKVYSRSGVSFEQTIVELQEQVALIQESHQNLRNQIYFNSESAPSTVKPNQIEYTS
jgi:hypothetical protein